MIKGISTSLKATLLIFLCSTTFAQRISNLPSPYGANYDPNKIIIKFKKNTNNFATLNNLGASLEHSLSRSGAGVYRLNGNMSAEEALSSLETNANVIYCEPDFIIELPDETVTATPATGSSSTPNDPYLPRLWGMQNNGQSGGLPGADISAVDAWGLQTTSNLVVAVIDTGVDYNHPDLINNIWTNTGEIPNNGIDDDHNGYIDDVHGYDFINHDSDPMDDNIHGTHVSGTIGAIGNNGVGVTGVCWGVKIMALKFLGSSGSGNISDAILALEYALNKGVKISNNSWGGSGYSQAFYDTLVKAQQEGHIFVAAAGNNGRDITNTGHYPSSFTNDNVLSIASTDANDNLSFFSNYSAIAVDLAAPGSEIYSTFPGAQYGYLNGTSMATPHVAGAAALVWARTPSLTYRQVIEKLMELGDPVDALEDKTVSGNRLNIYKAMTGTAPPYHMVVTQRKVDATLAPNGSRQATFQVKNLGVGTLTWSVSTTAPWLSISPTSGTATQGSPATITVTLSAQNLRAGDASRGVIQVVSNDPAHPSALINALISIPNQETILPNQDSLGFLGFDIANDGDDLIITGMPFALGFNGAAQIYRKTEGVWALETSLYPINPQAYETAGWAVAIKGDLAVVGSLGYNNVLVFRKGENGWAHEQTLTLPDYHYYIGTGISLESNEILVGFWGDGPAGRVYRYTYSGSTWQSQGYFSSPTPQAGDSFGYALQRSGNRLIVGAPNYNFSGRAFIYDLINNQWTPVATLDPPTSEYFDSFGFAVAISGDNALVGVPNETTNGFKDQGSAHLYCLNGGSWSHKAKLVSPDPSGNQLFGYEVSLAGSTAVVGAPTNGSQNGATYTFQKDGGAWNYKFKLKPVDGTNDTRAGFALAGTEGTVFTSGVTAMGGRGQIYSYDLFSDEAPYGPFTSVANTWHKSPLCATSTSYGATMGDLVKYLNNNNVCAE